MFASLKDGKLVVVIDTGTVTRGSGSSGTDREKDPLFEQKNRPHFKRS